VFRFTIRDLVLLTAVVATAAGWWIDRRRLVIANDELTKEVGELRTNYFQAALELIAARSTPQGEKRIRELHEAAKRSTLSRDDSQEVLFEVRHGDDFRTRVRAMAILPYLRERAEAIEALRAALGERGETSAEGVIPLYAAKYLAELKATESINDVRAWIEFVKSEWPYDRESRDTVLRTSETSLAKLIATSESSSPDHNDSTQD
jgi:hypothetical protein